MTSSIDIFTSRYAHMPQTTAGIILIKISVKENEISRPNIDEDNAFQCQLLLRLYDQ